MSHLVRDGGSELTRASASLPNGRRGWTVWVRVSVRGRRKRAERPLPPRSRWLVKLGLDLDKNTPRYGAALHRATSENDAPGTA
eukprot:scaffold3224_cov158-Amphora_coffeaeformis.AAC.25